MSECTHPKRGPLRIVAMAMKQRCTNPNHGSYKDYGANGVKMCSEWANDYAAFEAYCLANGWKKGLQVHRKGDVGNYEPGNIEFVTPQVHARLKKNLKLDVDKVKEMQIMRAKGMTQQSIADYFGVSSSNVCMILKRNHAWVEVEADPELLKGHKPINTMAQKLDYKTVWEIYRDHFCNDMGYKKLSKKYGISSGNLCLLLNGKTWKDVHNKFCHLLQFIPEFIQQKTNEQLGPLRLSLLAA